MPSPYLCPRHAMPLVARVLVVHVMYGRTRSQNKTRYFMCPVDGCDFKKPDKWAKRKRYGKEG